MSYQVIRGKLVKVGLRPQGGTNIMAVVREKAKIEERKELKGQKDGNCNVTACQRPGAYWWNTSTRAYYCTSCAREINRWSQHDEGYDICWPSKEAAIEAKAMFT